MWLLLLFIKQPFALLFDIVVSLTASIVHESTIEPNYLYQEQAIHALSIKQPKDILILPAD